MTDGSLKRLKNVIVGDRVVTSEGRSGRIVDAVLDVESCLQDVLSDDISVTDSNLKGIGRDWLMTFPG